MKDFSLNRRLQIYMVLPFVIFLTLISVFSYFKLTDSIIDLRKSDIKPIVEMSYLAVEQYYDEYKSGLLTEEQAKAEALKYIKAVDFDGHNYIWILNKNLSPVLHPKPELLIKNREFERNDQRTGKSLSQVIQESESGFVRYKFFDKQNGTKRIEKISYIKTFDKWGWVIGSGVYVNEILELSHSMIFNFVVIGVIGVIVYILLLVIFVGSMNTQITRPLKSAAKHLKLQASSLSSSSDQIMETGKSISTSAGEQNISLESAITAVEEIKGMASRNVEKANDSLTLASSVVEISNNGITSSDSLKETFKTIDSGNEHVISTLKRNEANMNEINSIISTISEKTKVINDIAFQTKLLSFNASVEAARAGEHGQGFSVVAQEIGNLANMSNGAADEIAVIVTDSLTKIQSIVQESSKQAELMIKTSEESSRLGEQSVEECKRSFHEIYDGVKKINEQIDSITLSSDEQSKGIIDVSESIISLKENANRNSLLASQALQISDIVDTDNKIINDYVQQIFCITNGESASFKVELKRIYWDDKYSVDIGEVDDDHKGILDRINLLIENLEIEDKAECITAFDDLISFSARHFADEEVLMQSINYPEFAAHKHMHTKLIAQLHKHSDNLKAGTLDTSRLVSFLQNWLVAHIMGVDTKYAKIYHNQHSHSA